MYPVPVASVMPQMFYPVLPTQLTPTRLPRVPASMQARPWGLPMGAGGPGLPGLPPGATVHHSKAWRRFPDPKRLKELRAMVLEYGSDPRLRWLAANLFQQAGVAERDYPAQAAVLLRYVQDAAYYTNETGEQIQSPLVTLQVRTGDCDCKGVLLASLAQSIRLPWRFMLAGEDAKGNPVRWMEPILPTDPKTPPKGWRFRHIYVALGWPPFSERSGRTQWASAEPTIKGRALGWDPVEARTSQLPELGAWGAAAPPAPTVPIKPAAAATLMTPTDETEEGISWKGVLIGAVQSAVTMAIAQVLLTAWEDYRRR